MYIVKETKKKNGRKIKKENKYSVFHNRRREHNIAQRGKMRKYVCEVCSKTDCELYLHHIVPIMLGGKSTEKNCITLCKDCHNEAHDKINRVLLEYFEDKQEELYEVLKGTALRQ